MKYSEDLTNEICKHLSAGMTRPDTCTMVGINQNTLYDWLAGAIPEDVFPEKLRRKKKPKIPEGNGTKESKKAIKAAYSALEAFDNQRMVISNEFCERIKKAELENKQRSMVIIQQAATKSWQAAAWWLERKYRDEYGQHVIQEHQGKLGFMQLFDNVTPQTLDANRTEQALQAGE